MNNTKEFLLDSLYIYTLILIGINLKPTLFICSLLGIYVFAFLYLIYKNGGCKGLKNIRYGIFILYTFICILAYIFVHRTYWHNKKYRNYLILSPFLFFVVVKFMETILQCKPHTAVNYALQFMTDVKKSLKL